MESHQYVICKLTKLIECKTNCLELLFMEKFQELSARYDKDMKNMKESLKLKFEKTNRHIDESVFTVLNKSQRFEYDLEKIYKKLLKLFVQPHQQSIAKSLYLKEQPCDIMDLAQYNPPECKCVKNIIPCNFNANKVNKCCCRPKILSRNHSEENVGDICYQFITPEKARMKNAKKPTKSFWKNQSPIAISTSQAIAINMPALDMIGFHNVLPAPVTLDNDGHSVNLCLRQLTPKEIKLGEFLPYITGGKLDSQYVFENCHFHWGSRNYMGTEHIVDDIQYVMEMHMIFTNKKYKDYKTAIGYSDGLVQMAFFYRIAEFDAPEVDLVVENLHNLEKIGNKVEMGLTFPLYSLIQSINLNRFFMYKGSLIQPPHSEVVTWIVFPEPLKISNSQIDRFRKVQLGGIDENPKFYYNFRDLQPLGNRRIFLREGKKEGYRVEDLDNIHHSKWQWYNS